MDNYKHGDLTVDFKTVNNNKVQYIVNQLTQEEMAEGWQLVVPRLKSKSTLHHFSIYLSQLPPHLWKKLYLSYTDNVKHYNIIKDGVYHYNVKLSKYDNDIKKMMKSINKYDYDSAHKLYNHLEKQRIKGWVMFYAKNKLNSN
jgi:hypothetical protein